MGEKTLAGLEKEAKADIRSCFFSLFSREAEAAADATV